MIEDSLINNSEVFRLTPIQKILAMKLLLWYGMDYNRVLHKVKLFFEIGL